MTEAGWTGEISDLFARMDDECQQVLDEAAVRAADVGAEAVGSEHVVLSILVRPDSAACGALVAHGMSYLSVSSFLSGLVPRGAAVAPTRAGADLVAGLNLAISSRPSERAAVPLRLDELLVAVVRVPGPTAKAVLDSYAVTPESIEQFLGTLGTGDAEADDERNELTATGRVHDRRRLPAEVDHASALVRAVVRDALAEGLTLDGLVHKLVVLDQGMRARASLTLRGLDVDRQDLAEFITELSPALEQATTTDRTDDVGRALSDLPAWLCRTGDDHPDTLHLLLAALATVPDAAFAKALKTFGVTDDLLVSAGMEVRSDIGPQDKPGVPESVSSSPMRKPAPSSSMTQLDPLGKLAGVRFRRRLFRGQTTSADNVNTDLQLRRIRRWLAITTVSAVAGLLYVTLLVGAAVASGNWWLLLAIPAAGLQPSALPLPLCLAGWVAAGCLSPGPARVVLVILATSACLSAWHEVQWRRSDTASARYGLRRMRRDTRISRRSLLLGGPT